MGTTTDQIKGGWALVKNLLSIVFREFILLHVLLRVMSGLHLMLFH